MGRIILKAALFFTFCSGLHAQDTKQLLAAIQGNDKDPTTPRSRHAYTDLDGDGVDDAIVLMLDPSLCGSGGCTMSIFRGVKTGFEFVSRSTITNEPIRVSQQKNANWRALIVYAKGVGDVILRFDGKRYPSNPSTQPKATAVQVAEAQILIKSFPVTESSAWQYTETVRYQSLSEPHGITLQDGRVIDYQSMGAFTTWQLDSWPKQKELILAYSSDYGAVLLDPQTDAATSIWSISGKHPIDQIQDQCLEKESTTSGMVSCFATALSMWDKELNRFYNELMSILNAEQKLALQTAQCQWIQFRDAEKAAINAIDTEGTISRINRAGAINQITREQVRRLGLLLAR